MHEAGIAENLLDTVLDEAKIHNGRPVRITISCGTFSGVNDELLRLAFRAIAEDTICSDAEIEVRHIPITAQCSKCGEKFEYDIVSPNCKKCGSEKFELLPDPPLLLENIEFETE